MWCVAVNIPHYVTSRNVVTLSQPDGSVGTKTFGLCICCLLKVQRRVGGEQRPLVVWGHYKLKTFTVHRRRPESGTETTNISVSLLDPVQAFRSSELHERAKLTQRAAERRLVVYLGTSAMFGSTKRVVGHDVVLWVRRGLHKNTDLELDWSSGSGLTRTLWLWEEHMDQGCYDEYCHMFQRVKNYINDLFTWGE